MFPQGFCIVVSEIFWNGDNLYDDTNEELPRLYSKIFHIYSGVIMAANILRIERTKFVERQCPGLLLSNDEQKTTSQRRIKKLFTEFGLDQVFNNSLRFALFYKELGYKSSPFNTQILSFNGNVCLQVTMFFNVKSPVYRVVVEHFDSKEKAQNYLLRLQIDYTSLLCPFLLKKSPINLIVDKYNVRDFSFSVFSEEQQIQTEELFRDFSIKSIYDDVLLLSQFTQIALNYKDSEFLSFASILFEC